MLLLHCIALYCGWLGSRMISVLDSGAERPGFKSQSRRCQTVQANCSHPFTHCASALQAAKLVAALLRVAVVTAGLAESDVSLPPGLWLTSPAGWLPRTGICSGTLPFIVLYCISDLETGIYDFLTVLFELLLAISTNSRSFLPVCFPSSLMEPTPGFFPSTTDYSLQFWLTQSYEWHFFHRFHRLRPPFSANPSHRNLLFRLHDWLRGFPGLFTDTSEHINPFLLFTFYFFPTL